MEQEQDFEGFNQADVLELSAQLGHSRKSMTLDFYSHVLLEEGV